MRKIRRFALILAIIMMIMILAGCNVPSTPSTTSTTSQSTSSTTQSTTEPDRSFVQNADGSFISGGIEFPLKEKMTYTFFRPADALTLDALGGDIQNSTFWQELEARTNIHFEFITPALGTEREQYNLIITSGELPDILSNPGYFSSGLDAGVDDGYFVDLTSLLPIYAPEYLAVVEQSLGAKDILTDTGRHIALAMVFTHPQLPFAGYVIRKDWLDELQLSIPKTYDQLEAALTAFKEQKNVEAPLVLTKTLYWMLGIGYGFNFDTFGRRGGLYQIDGKVYDSFLDNGDRSKEFFTMLNRWYENGLIDQNFMSLSDWFPNASFLNSGHSGVAQAMYSSVGSSLKPVMDAGGELAAIPWPVENEGEVIYQNSFSMITTVSQNATISTDCAHPETLLAMFNYLFTEEGFMLSNYGEKDVHYTLDAQDNVKFTEMMMSNIQSGIRKHTLPPSWGPSYFNPDRQNPAISQQAIDMQATWAIAKGDYNMPAVTLTAEEQAEYANIAADLITFIEENTLQFITGAKSLDEWDLFIETIKNMGLPRCVEIYQQALDRYNAR